MNEEPKSTKDRILDAAEVLIGERGPGETSLRDITAAAGVNLAAVNYHFQSKEALLRAVVERRVVPLNQRRLDLLDAAEAAAGENPPDLGKVMEAFLFPPLEMLATSPRFVPLMARIYTEPQFVEEIIRKYMFPLVPRFTAALQRACPDLSMNEVFWRMHFSIGSMTHLLAGANLIRVASQGQCDPADIEPLKKQLITFLTAGFRAPAP